MKKKIFTCATLILMALLLFIMPAANVKAADKKMKANKWTTVKQGQFVKIKIKKKGYIKVRFAEGAESRCLADDLEIYTKNKKKLSSYGVVYTGTVKLIPVTKGTYYLRAKGDDAGSRIKVRYSFKRDKITNTRKSKARKLKVDKMYYPVGFYAKDGTRTRYYKFTLKTSKKIRALYQSYNTEEYGFSGPTYSSMKMTLVNKAGKVIKTVKEKNGIVSASALTAGKYYLKVTVSFDQKAKAKTLGNLGTLSIQTARD